MEMKINSEKVKQLRNQQSWSQDQLATVSGLSLRTIQRIENMGTCSLESKRALAAVFEMDIEALTFKAHDLIFAKQNRKGRRMGFIGVGLGVACAYTVVFWSLINGYMSYEAAGIHFGVVGAMSGMICAAIGVLSNRVLV